MKCNINRDYKTFIFVCFQVVTDKDSGCYSSDRPKSSQCSRSSEEPSATFGVSLKAAVQASKHLIFRVV